MKVHTKFECQNIGEALKLLIRTVFGRGDCDYTFTRKSGFMTRKGAILDLVIVPKIIHIVNGDEDGVDLISMSDDSNILAKQFGDIDDIVSAPLQKHC